MVLSVILVSLFSFSLVLAQEDTDDSSGNEDDNSGSEDDNSGNEDDNSGNEDDNSGSGSDDSSGRDDDTGDDDDTSSDKDNRGPSEKDEFKTRTRTVTRGDETFTITDTREITRTRDEDGTLTDVRIRLRETTNDEGEVIHSISTERIRERFQGEDGVEVETELRVEVDGEERVNIVLSNNERRELRVLPDQASDVARERLKLRNLTKIELREIRDRNIPRVVYHLEGDKPGRFLGIFKLAMKVSTEVDPETGEVIEVNRPWWAFLVNEEEDEIPEDDTQEEVVCSDLTTEVECNDNSDCQNVFDENQLWSACEEILEVES